MATSSGDDKTVAWLPSTAADGQGQGSISLIPIPKSDPARRRTQRRAVGPSAISDVGDNNDVEGVVCKNLSNGSSD